MKIARDKHPKEEIIRDSLLKEEYYIFPCCCSEITKKNPSFEHTEASKFMINLLNKDDEEILDRPIYSPMVGKLHNRDQGSYQQDMELLAPI